MYDQVWFQEPDATDWKDVQFEWLFGYNIPTLTVFFREWMDWFSELEDAARDVVNIVIRALQLIMCEINGGLMLGNIGGYERPQANMRAKLEYHLPKRERLSDRVWDSTHQEQKWIRCIKSAGDQVDLVAVYFLKVPYWPFKSIARWFFGWTKVICSAVRGLLSMQELSVSLGFDPGHCFKLGSIISVNSAIALKGEFNGSKSDLI